MTIWCGFVRILRPLRRIFNGFAERTNVHSVRLEPLARRKPPGKLSMPNDIKTTRASEWKRKIKTLGAMDKMILPMYRIEFGVD